MQIKTESFWQPKKAGSPLLEGAINELSGVAELERAAVTETALRLIPLVNQRVAAYRVILGARIPAICLSTASIYPAIGSSFKQNQSQIQDQQTISSRTLASVSEVDSDKELALLVELATFSLVIVAIDDITDGLIVSESPNKQLSPVISDNRQPQGRATQEEVKDYAQGLDLFLTLCNQVVQSGGASNAEFESKLADIASTLLLTTPAEDQEAGDRKEWSALLPAEWIEVLKLLALNCHNFTRISPASTTLYRYSLFARRFERLMQTMARELEWGVAFRKRQALPSFEDYLSNGCDSIASPALLTALLTMLPSYDLSETVASNGLTAKIAYLTNEENHLIEEITLKSGAVIRLINDIGGFEREQAEQKPNAMTILMTNRQDLSTEAAKNQLLQIADGYLSELEREVGTNLVSPASVLSSFPGLGLAEWGQCVLRLTRFCRDYSLTREFYDFSREQLARLATAVVETPART